MVAVPVPVSAQELQQQWLTWAGEALAEKQEEYTRFEDYYNGDHELAFATDKWATTFGTIFEEFADNWCGVVVDSMVQRLEITGWTTEGGNKDEKEKWIKTAEEIWDRNELHVEEEDLNIQTLVKGDSYLMVWPDPDENEKQAEVYFNDALYTSVFYDPTRRRRIARATKSYIDMEGIPHLYIYTPERILEYQGSMQTPPNTLAMMQMRGEVLDILPNGWILLEDDPNPYGEVPVFHFRNKSGGGTHGMSELKSVIPVQNAVNKLLMDLMVASEFGSFRQKWVAGGGVPRNPDGTSGWKTGGDRVWHTTDPTAKFGEFGQVDLEPIFRAIDSLVGHIAKITQTPMHYLRTSGDMPSGEALKTAESGLVGKCKERQKSLGASWSKAMTFAVRLELGLEKLDKPLMPVWRDPEIRHDLEQAQTAQLKSIMGIPLEQLWSEHFDYTQEQIDEFTLKNKALAAAVLAQVVAQVGQLPPGSEAVGATPQQLIDLVQASGAVTPTADGESGLDVSQILAMLPKGVTAQTTAGEATTKPQPNTTPPASPTRRSRGFRD